MVGGVWIHRRIDCRQRSDRVLHIRIVPGACHKGIRMGSGHVLLDTARRPWMCGGGVSLSWPRHRSLRDSPGLIDVHRALRAVACLAVADPLLAGRIHRDGRPGRTAQRGAGAAAVRQGGIGVVRRAPRPRAWHRDDRDRDWRHAGAAVRPRRHWCVRVAYRLRGTCRADVDCRVSGRRDFHPGT